MEAKAPNELLYRWLLACGVFALLLFFFSPSWGAFRAWSRAPELGFMLETRRGVVVLEQVAHPGTAVSDTLHSAIQWRLLFPVIGRGLHLSGPAFFGLAHAGCVLVLGFIITVLRRRGVGWVDAGFVATSLGAGSWFFASVCWLGYFDSWLVLGLLIVAFGRSPRSVWLACLWAPWVDERFVIGAPLAMLCRYCLRPASAQDQSPGALQREFAVPAALLAGFAVIRLGVLAGPSAPGATIGGYFANLQFGDAPGARIAAGIWEGLRAGWFFVLLAAALLPRRQGVALTAAALGLMAAGLATAQDFSRAMMLVLPLGLAGAVRAFETRPRWLPLALRGAAAAALLLPGHLVMSNYVQPVQGFYHELAALDNPPALLRPESYELRAIHAMEQGLPAQAEADLGLAIKLAANPAGPSKQRGILYASAGRWEEARRDFAVMVQYAPEDPEAWFFRAQAQLALGDPAAARADMQQATARAPADWAARPDVARFLVRLGQAR